jgi:hypothetical protein
MPTMDTPMTTSFYQNTHRQIPASSTSFLIDIQTDQQMKLIQNTQAKISNLHHI